MQIFQKQMQCSHICTTALNDQQKRKGRKNEVRRKMLFSPRLITQKLRTDNLYICYEKSSCHVNWVPFSSLPALLISSFLWQLFQEQPHMTEETLLFQLMCLSSIVLDVTFSLYGKGSPCPPYCHLRYVPFSPLLDEMPC